MSLIALALTATTTLNRKEEGVTHRNSEEYWVDYIIALLLSVHDCTENTQMRGESILRTHKGIKAIGHFSEQKNK